MRTDRPDEQSTEAPGERAQDDLLEQEGAGGDAPEAEGRSGEPDAGELASLRDRHLRLAAEYDNYRKRTERERTDSWNRAQAQLLERLLEPLDDLQRVAHFSADTTTVEALLEGTQMVERKLLRLLEGAGVEVIDAEGRPFDPAVHEALMTVPTDEPEEDETVGQVFQRGYQFKGALLRPARVQVKKYEG